MTTGRPGTAIILWNYTKTILLWLLIALRVPLPTDELLAAGLALPDIHVDVDDRQRCGTDCLQHGLRECCRCRCVRLDHQLFYLHTARGVRKDNRTY